jgi:hypothetical protein
MGNFYPTEVLVYTHIPQFLAKSCQRKRKSIKTTIKSKLGHYQAVHPIDTPTPFWYANRLESRGEIIQFRPGILASINGGAVWKNS